MARRPAAPQAIVIFGASGDLTKRKLLPAFFHLYLEGMLPEQFAIVGYARTVFTDEEFREHARNAVKEFGKREPVGEVWMDFAKHLRYVPGEFSDAGAMKEVAADLQDIDATHGTQGNRFFYCATPPDAYPDIVKRIGEAGLQVGREDRVREAVRTRPGQRARAEPVHPRRVRRVAGVPDRPLPGQGDRPEHPGVPVRERPVRADLEPPLHRPRADHGGRESIGDRGPRRVLRADGRDPRPGLDAPVPDDDVPGHGAARLVRTRPAPRRDREGAAVGAVLRSHAAGARPVPGLPLRAGHLRSLEHRDVRGAAAWISTTGAGPTCRSSCGPARAWPGSRPRSR